MFSDFTKLKVVKKLEKKIFSESKNFSYFTHIGLSCAIFKTTEKEFYLKFLLHNLLIKMFLSLTKCLII